MKKRTLILTTLILITIITISIIYNTLPRLQLNGSKNIIQSYREEYEEAGVIVKNANSKYMSKIKTDSNIDSKKIGNYYIDYSLKIGGKTLHVRRNVKIIDDIAPIIKLKGNQIIEMSINKEYKEPGYTAQDEYDGELTEQVETIGEVDTTNYGEYVITYKVKDNSNNITEVNRIVKIIDEEPPKIKCNTEYSAFKINSEKLIGCKAQDNFDGDITEKIETIGDYDKTTPGIYNIKYSVKDDAGNLTENGHNIIIYDEHKEKTKKIEINIEESQIEQVIETLNEIEIAPTIYIRLKSNKITQSEEPTIEKILKKTDRIGILENKDSIDLKTFKDILEQQQKTLKETYDIEIKKYKFIEKNATIEEIKEYLKDNKIDYSYSINKIEDITESTRQEILENTIKSIITNQYEEQKQYDIDNSKETLTVLKEIINIQKEINPELEVELNIK